MAKGKLTKKTVVGSQPKRDRGVEKRHALRLIAAFKRDGEKGMTAELNRMKDHHSLPSLQKLAKSITATGGIKAP